MACQSAIQNCIMTGSPLRRLQEFAAVLRDGLALFASDEGGEPGGRPVRVQSKFVMKSRARNPRFNRDTLILVWQTWPRESCSTGTACVAVAVVPPVRQFLPRSA